MADSDRSVTEAAHRILDRYRTFAVVGASANPSRPSYGVMGVLEEHGYETIPVNPNVEEVRGRTAYPDLASIPDDVEVEVVDLFRHADAVEPHVDEAIEVGAKAVWMQLGVVNEAAARKARDAGLEVVMDRCPAIELRSR
jgi:predicted CoA-binding protein